MASEIETIVKGLAGASDITGAYATVTLWNLESRTADLVHLAAAIEAACDVAGAARFPYEAVADHVEEVLALSTGAGRLEALLSLLSTERVKSVEQPRTKAQRVRAFASRLGYGQPKEALLDAMDRLGEQREHTELLACWMHEMVLRGTPLEGEPVATRFHARLVELEHPLHALPLKLLPAEAEAPTYMPMYGANAVSTAVQRLESGPSSAPTLPPPRDQAQPLVEPLVDEALTKRLVEAVGPWTSGSRGNVEAKAFRVSPSIGTSGPGKWLLRALPLACLEGVTPLRAERTGAEAVWGALFAAAANGGAYTSGLGGAYGRRAAWTSLGAMVDAPVDAPLVETDVRAGACAFLMFGGPGGFWHDVAWDIGALAVREDGASVAVLAATDTD